MSASAARSGCITRSRAGRVAAESSLSVRAPSGKFCRRGIPEDVDDQPPVSVDNQQRKRKRLNAVLDKLNSNLLKSSPSSSAASSLVSNGLRPSSGVLDNNNRKERRARDMFPSAGQQPEDLSVAEGALAMSPRPQSSAALRREQWRDNQQQSVEEHMTTRNYLQASDGGRSGSSNRSNSGEAVFKFDSFDRDRYLSGGSSVGGGGGGIQPDVTIVPLVTPVGGGLPVAHPSHPPVHYQSLSVEEHSATQAAGETETFSPVSGRSPHSSLSSPQVSVDSPRICFSPLRIKDSIEEEDQTVAVLHNLPRLSVRGCESEEASGSEPGALVTGTAGGLAIPSVTAAAATLGGQRHWLNPRWDYHHPYAPGQRYVGGGGSISRPLSPNPPSGATPPMSISPCATPLHSLRHLPAYLTEAYRRRCHSDTDLTNPEDEPGVGRGSQANLLRPGGGKHRMGKRGFLAAGGSRSTERARDSPSPSPAPPGTLLVGHQGHHLHFHSHGHAGPPYQAQHGSRYLSLPAKGGSLESEASSTATHEQESPLDLSVRSSISSCSSGAALRTAVTGSVESIHGRSGRTKTLGRSPKAIRGCGSVSGSDSLERHSLDFADPAIATDPVATTTTAPSDRPLGGLTVLSSASADMAYVCPICGQVRTHLD